MEKIFYTYTKSDSEEKPPRDPDECFSDYSVPVIGWCDPRYDKGLILGLVRWDFDSRGWVYADFRDGMNPSDYVGEFKVNAWALVPEPDFLL